MLRDVSESSIGDAKTSAGSAAPAPDTLAPGTLFGQYRILRLLGRGGMGEVYEVEHKVLRRKYALKLLPPTLEWRGVALERFEREAQVMANLEHPNIIRVDEFGETEGRYWLRMELAGGVECSVTSDQCSGKRVVSLQDLADAWGGKIPQEELLAILKQVLAGLDYAHQRGAIHRDLKPSNILLFPSLQHSNTPLIKITDFGLVRLVGEDWVRSQAQLSVQRSLSLGDQPTMGKAESEGTSTRSLLGTYEYMSPEQKRGEDADQRSDLYALGVVTYRLLTGRNIGPKLPSRIDRNLSAAWDEVVELALEEDAAMRLASCGDFVQKLPFAGSPVLEPTKADGRELPLGKPIQLDLGSGVIMDFLWIPPGKFLRGSPDSEVGRLEDEGPQHEVTIAKGFWMGRTPVTQAQFELLTGENPSRFKQHKSLEKNSFRENPVEWVNWTQAREFCVRLQTRFREIFYLVTADLPFEAEWEYACRAGTTGPYAGDLNEMGWYSNISEGRVHPVGQKKPNPWGLCDMHGNVWEWCKDGKCRYSTKAQVDPHGPESPKRILRGGSWYNTMGYCRSASRSVNAKAYACDISGFRVVLR